MKKAKTLRGALALLLAAVMAASVLVGSLQCAHAEEDEQILTNENITIISSEDGEEIPSDELTIGENGTLEIATADDEEDASAEEETESNGFMSTKYLVTVGIVLGVLIAFYVFLVVKTNGNKKSAAKKPVKKSAAKHVQNNNK